MSCEYYIGTKQLRSSLSPRVRHDLYLLRDCILHRRWAQANHILESLDTTDMVMSFRMSFKGRTFAECSDAKQKNMKHSSKHRRFQLRQFYPVLYNIRLRCLLHEHRQQEASHSTATKLFHTFQAFMKMDPARDTRTGYYIIVLCRILIAHNETLDNALNLCRSSLATPKVVVDPNSPNVSLLRAYEAICDYLTWFRNACLKGKQRHPVNMVQAMRHYDSSQSEILSNVDGVGGGIEVDEEDMKPPNSKRTRSALNQSASSSMSDGHDTAQSEYANTIVTTTSTVASIRAMRDKLAQDAQTRPIANLLLAALTPNMPLHEQWTCIRCCVDMSVLTDRVDEVPDMLHQFMRVHPHYWHNTVKLAQFYNLPLDDDDVLRNLPEHMHRLDTLAANDLLRIILSTAFVKSEQVDDVLLQQDHILSLLGVLDHGSLREHEHSWQLLLCLVRRQYKHKTQRAVTRLFLSAECWAPRRRWWPRFHAAHSSPVTSPIKDKVIKMLSRSWEENNGQALDQSMATSNTTD